MPTSVERGENPQLAPHTARGPNIEYFQMSTSVLAGDNYRQCSRKAITYLLVEKLRAELLCLSTHSYVPHILSGTYSHIVHACSLLNWRLMVDHNDLS